jgi:hypothetical protein
MVQTPHAEQYRYAKYPPCAGIFSSPSCPASLTMRVHAAVAAAAKNYFSAGLVRMRHAQ